MIKVYQAVDFCDAHDAAIANDSAKLTALWLAGRYEPVADVADPGGPGHNLQLERAYRLTNSIDCAWWENDGVIKTISRPCRSTSCGDILELGGRYYFVAMCGFNWINIQ